MKWFYDLKIGLKLQCSFWSNCGFSLDDLIDRLLWSPSTFSQLSLRHPSFFKNLFESLARS